ncbi:hypothetical protein CO670_26890 [Rhizobium sp. J15]|uniref:hypothetical protein n=1 Tax=Rhizobium sp. J15 TaxID=2035450 RepID=UPI000BE8FA26|nr:hypothetical protein [Rhizobium sp. J15]PDT13661.1 hypothetical protein CO670_26890 [Rhizobium sp. J15]
MQIKLGADVAGFCPAPGGLDSDGLFGLAAARRFVRCGPMPLPVSGKAGIPLLFRQHLVGKLPQRLDESIGF